MKVKYWDKEELTELYYTQGKTLEEIGIEKGVTRERVRQCMEHYNIPRRPKKGGSRKSHPYFRSLEDYLSRSKGSSSGYIKIFFPDNLYCSECGSSKHIHIHHIIYPAKAINDLQILCSSCHKLKHNNKMTLIRQHDLFNDYKTGNYTYKSLALKYNIHLSLVSVIIRKLRNNWHTLRG